MKPTPVLLEVLDPVTGKVVDKCDRFCHYKLTDEPCICGGKYRGIGEKAIDVPWEELNEMRDQLAKDGKGPVQLRIGA